ncbi:MAG: hypothetical protein PHE20_00685 [Patescibacteria group bacterium]|nr:hypothetical protein [Patescibacteria group bacterium]
MSFLRRKFFVYFTLALALSLSFYPFSTTQAKTISAGTASDIFSVPGQLLNGKLAGTGNRCLYVDASGNVSAKGVDCGTSTGGDDMGTHIATQNIRLGNYWLSGDGGNEGIAVSSIGRVGINTNNPGAELQISTPASTEGLRIISASDWSPLNIMNSAGTVDIFRVDQTGSLAVGIIPGARVSGAVGSATTATTATTATSLAANGANCSSGYYPLGVNASGAVENCMAIPADSDIYWNGSSVSLNASTGRTSLGLGALATINSVANAQITDVAWSKITGFPTACSAGQYVSAVGGTLTCSTPATGSDIYWNGSSTGLNATTGRSSLGLGALATINSVANAQITDVAWSKITGFPTACSAGQYVSAVGGTLTCSTPPSGSDIYWNGSSTGLNASTGRSSLGLGSLATQSNLAWSQLTSFPTACSAGQYVSAVGGTLTCSTPPSGSDIYWSGSSTGLNATTGRSSLGLGSLATLSTVTSSQISNGTIADIDVSSSANISASKIQNGTYFITSAGTNGQVWTSDGSGAGNWATAAGGISGSGTANYLSKWTGSSSQGNSIIYDNGTNVGVGLVPTAKLDVNGSFRANSSISFPLLAAARGETYAVTIDESGTLGSTAISGGSGLPSGTQHQTMRYNGSAWAATSNLWNNGVVVGINTTPTSLCDMTTKLSVNGTINTSKLHLTRTDNTSCYTSADIAYDTGTGYLNFTTSGNGYVFDSPIRAAYKSADNSTGITSTLYLMGCNSLECHMTIKNGIVTANTCPTTTCGAPIIKD